MPPRTSSNPASHNPPFQEVFILMINKSIYPERNSIYFDDGTLFIQRTSQFTISNLCYEYLLNILTF